jgi:hypothetical protein
MLVYPRQRSLSRAVVVRILVLAAAVLLSLGVSVAQAATPAPGYSVGPDVVGGDLLWGGISSGQESVFLSTATSTRVLVSDAALSAVHVDHGWEVVVGPTGLRVGRLGRRLSEIPALQRCPPVLGEGEARDPLATVANDNIYVVVRASCFGRGAERVQVLASAPIGAGSLHLIGRVRSGALSMVAAGRRLAITYGAAERQTVAVINARNARVLYRVMSPRNRRDRYRETQLDAKGDVLVIRASGDVLSSSALAWWWDASSRRGQSVKLNKTVDASLADGRIAYVTGRSIYIRNLGTGATRRLVTFSGTTLVEGVGLGKTVLAWAQRNYGYTVDVQRTESGLPSYSCVALTPIGSAELVQMPASAPRPLTVKTTLGARPAGPSCLLQ